MSYKEKLNKVIFDIKRAIIRLMEICGHRYKYVTIFDYVKQHPDKAKILFEGVEDTVYTEAINYAPNEKRESYMPVLQTGIKMYDWLAVIEDAKCFHYSDLIVTSDGYALYDIKDYKSISQYGDYRDGVIFRDTDKYCKIRRRKTIQIEEAFFLDGLFSWNWYHFITQVLPKVKYLNQIPEGVPVLVGPHAEGNNNFHTILRLFLNRYAPNRKVIYMQNNKAYQPKRLYVASSQGLLIPNLKENVKGGVRAEWCLYKQSTLEFLRETLLKEIDTKKKYQETIYISRKNASERRRFNEEEISAMMQKEGFAVVAPEEYTVQEQIALFNHAKCIVACSGAALTNLLCCQNGCKVIIFNNYKQHVGVFNTIATIAGAESLMINGYDYEMSGDNVQDAFTIETQNLKSAMCELKMA